MMIRRTLTLPNRLGYIWDSVIPWPWSKFRRLERRAIEAEHDSRQAREAYLVERQQKHEAVAVSNQIAQAAKTCAQKIPAGWSHVQVPRLMIADAAVYTDTDYPEVLPKVMSDIHTVRTIAIHVRGVIPDGDGCRPEDIQHHVLCALVKESANATMLLFDQQAPEQP